MSRSVVQTGASRAERNRRSVRAASAVIFTAGVLVSAGMSVQLVPGRPARAKSRAACQKAGCRFNAKLWKCVCPRKGRFRGGPMVRVPAGCYTRGSNDKSVRPDRRPQHRVCLSTFHIDKYEVTVKQYGRCVAAGRCTHPVAHNPYHHAHKHCTWKGKGTNDHPVNCVDWHQARAFCKWANKRLPTEAEWEYAAVGGDGRTYPWGNQWEGLCGYAIIRTPHTRTLGCGRNSTWPVGSRPTGKSPFGALDMAGNVMEWVEDCYDPGYYAKCGSSCKDPVNRCATQALRSLRGSSWASPPIYVKPAIRKSSQPSTRAWGIGFRCAR